MVRGRSTTRLLFVRHGQHGHGGRFWQHGCPGLTPLGRAQAAAVAEALLAASDMESVDAVLASKATRARETAQPTADAFGVEVVESCDLCEMHPGAAEGLTPTEMTERFGPTYAYVPGAVHYPDWLPGAVSTLRGLTDAYDDRTVVAFTQTGVLKATLIAFGNALDEEAATFAPANGSITEWQRTSRGPFRLVRAGDVTHLTRFS